LIFVAVIRRASCGVIHSRLKPRVRKGRLVPVRSVPEIASRQRGLFTRQQAFAAGWSQSALTHALHGGELRQVRRGIYVPIAAPSGIAWQDARREHVIQAVAALISHPKTWASHTAASVLLDLPVLDVPRQPCLTVGPGHTGTIDGVHLHRSRLWRGDLGRLGQLPLTSPARTVTDVARERGVEAGLVVADAVLRRNLASAQALEDSACRCRGWPGARHAREVAHHADPRAESALESRSRWRLLNTDLPEVWPQTEIWIDGRFVGRVDFYWDELGVIGEADGWDKYEIDRSRFRYEKRQQESYERAGAAVVRWETADLDRFDDVVRRIREYAAVVARRPRSARRWIARRGQLGRVS